MYTYLGRYKRLGSRVSTGAKREQIAFQLHCSLPIHNADRKSVGNGTRRREQRTCRNKTSSPPSIPSSPTVPRYVPQSS